MDLFACFHVMGTMDLLTFMFAQNKVFHAFLPLHTYYLGKFIKQEIYNINCLFVIASLVLLNLLINRDEKRFFFIVTSNDFCPKFLHIIYQKNSNHEWLKMKIKVEYKNDFF